MDLGAFKVKGIVVSIVLLVATGLMGFKCALARTEVLEYDNVFQYKLEADAKTNVPKGISGLCGKSSYCVSSISVQTNGSTILVLVEVGLGKKGESGRFSVPLEIPSDIKEVRFGTKGYLLWSR